MVATAPPAQRWLLVEHSGPWPINALDALGPRLARDIATRAAREQARVSLIRRPGRHARVRTPTHWAVADVRPGFEGIRWFTGRGPEEILEQDWDVEPSEGEPLALVCAHSRHDVCCAVRGRPVAAMLEQVWPGRVWECSHLGGDRFAATMVLLPDGLCYGRVEPTTGPAILQAHERGEVLSTLLRGRCAYHRREQAAQALARAAGHGPNAIEALRPLSLTQLAPDTSEVVLAQPSLHVVVRERVVQLGTPATCRSSIDAIGYEFDLVSMTPGDEPGP